eukprot:COSAG06_NODE_1843_length_8232_cov_21.062585_1_plen_159_part_00
MGGFALLDRGRYVRAVRRGASFWATITASTARGTISSPRRPPASPASGRCCAGAAGELTTLSSLVRGSLSLGSLLEQHGYATTPSASRPTPVSEDALRSTLSEALGGRAALHALRGARRHLRELVGKSAGSERCAASGGGGRGAHGRADGPAGVAWLR